MFSKYLKRLGIIGTLALAATISKGTTASADTARDVPRAVESQPGTTAGPYCPERAPHGAKYLYSTVFFGFYYDYYEGSGGVVHEVRCN